MVELPRIEQIWTTDDEVVQRLYYMWFFKTDLSKPDYGARRRSFWERWLDNEN